MPSPILLSLSDADYLSQIENLQANTVGLEEMVVARSVIEIGAASAKYWIDDHEPSGVAPWVAQDMAGALVGGTVQAVSTGGDLDATLRGAAIGAVSASLGLVRVVARGITKFFGW